MVIYALNCETRSSWVRSSNFLLYSSLDLRGPSIEGSDYNPFCLEVKNRQIIEMTVAPRRSVVDYF